MADFNPDAYLAAKTSWAPSAFDPDAYLAAKTQSAGPMSIGDVANGAVINFPSSAMHLGENIITPIMHPIETAKNLYHLGAGIIEKAIPGTQADEATANAVGKYFSDRYGGLENVKKTIATDPAGFLADASVVLGGGGAALKATGTLAKAAEVADRAGTVANPIALALKAGAGAKNIVGKGLTEALGVTTGAGPQSIRTAYGAGLQGGKAADAFQANMRGNVPIANIVSDARGALGNIRSQRGNDYLAGMGSVNSDPTVLSLSPVDKAVAASNDINSFKGVDLASSTAVVRQKIADKLAQWHALDPAEYHTAAGMDALKRSIGDIRDTTQYGSPDRIVANAAYNAVKDTIVQQAPQYSKVMKNYADASDNLSDIQGTMSLGPGKPLDTAIRKLQSGLRDNVNTSYGHRTSILQELADNGAPNIMESIAGQTLASPTARGIGKVLTGGELATAGYELMHGNVGNAASIIPALLAQSPRLVGEGAYYAGKGARLGKALGVKQTAAAKAGLLADLLGQQDNNSQMPSAAFINLAK